MSRSLDPAAKHWQRMVLNAAAAAGGGGAGGDPVYQWSRTYTAIDASNVTNMTLINNLNGNDRWLDETSPPQYLEIDLGASVSVNGVSVYNNNTDIQKQRWLDADIYFSNSPGSYGAASFSGVSALAPGSFAWGNYNFASPVIGRYMKVVINDTGHASDYAGCYEMRVRKEVAQRRSIGEDEWAYHTVSSGVSGCGGTPTSAFDGNTGTSMYHVSSDQTHWVQWDMGEELWVAGVRRYSAASGSIFDWNDCYFQVRKTASEDWETVVSGLNLSGTGWKDSGNQAPDTPGYGRYCRLNFQKNPLSNAYLRVYEIQPYVAPLVAI